MNILDILILLIIAASVLNGLRRGFVLQVSRFVGLILALVVAFRFSPDLAEGLKQLIPLSEQGENTASWIAFLPMDLFLYRVIAFALLFFGTKLIVRLIAGLLNQVVSLPVLNTVNRLAGFILAAVQAFIILFIVVNVLQFVPGPKMHSLLEESLIASWMIDQTPVLTDWLKDWIKSPKT